MTLFRAAYSERINLCFYSYIGVNPISGHERIGSMKKRNEKPRRAVAALLALGLTVMQIPGHALATEDYNETVNVVASDYSTDKSAEVGDITVPSGSDAAQVYAFDGKSASLVAGNITGGDESKGVDTSATHASSSATTTVNGNVVTGDDAVETSAIFNGSAVVTVNGDVLAYQTGTGVVTSAEGCEGEGETTANVTVNGNVSGVASGIDAYAIEGGSATTTVNGDVSGASRGVNATAEDSGKVDVTVNGDVSSYEIGIRTESQDEGSSTDVTVIGNVTATYDYGIREKTDRGGSSNVTVTGDVTGAVGALAATFGDTEYFFGDIDDAENDYALSAIDGGTITLVIDGDLTGTSGAGLEVGMSGKSGTVDALVTGTISGNASNGYAGVDIWDTDAANNTSLTTWKITPNSEGTVASVEHGSDPSELFEAAINYIVKVLQPEVGASLSVTNAAGEALGQSHGYDVAHEGETVLLKVDLEPGYVLVGAYGDAGKQIPLSQDADGNWYLQVPKGGGVMLNAVVKPMSDLEPDEPVTPEPEPDEPVTPEPEPTLEPEPAADEPATPAKATTAAVEPATQAASTTPAAQAKTKSAAAAAMPATGDETPVRAMTLVLCTSLVAFAASAILRRKDAAGRRKHAAR